jgi:hypothetical protein
MFNLLSVRCMYVAAAIGMSAAPARGDVIWNEPVQGDLSDDRFAPTPLVLMEGSNELFGVMQGGDGEVFDRDFFSVTVPEGHVLSRIVLGFYFSVDRTAFIAVQRGALFPEDPDAPDPSAILGWTHFGPSEVGGDLLALMGMNGQGFAPPLGAGTYSFWAQQTDNFTEHALDFVIEVPGPGGTGTVVVMISLAGGRRRKRERIQLVSGEVARTFDR